jgi:hypothetical protein
MNFNRRHFLGAVIAGSTGLVSQRAFAAVKLGERPALLGQAMAALDSHGSRIFQRDVVGLVDFSLPSRDQRFHLVDVASGRVVTSFLVAHGRGSDPANSGWATRFSNRPGSNASSEGSYRIGDAYYGKHGRSRRLHGLDPVNSLALQRTIVIHGASYVDAGMAANQGRIGRSLGCFAVQQHEIDKVLDRLGPGRLLFAKS